MTRGSLLSATLAIAAAAAAVGRRRALAEADDARRETVERERRKGAEIGRLRDQLRRRDAALRRERELLLRLQQLRRAEREWNRELGSQLQRLQDARDGANGGSGDAQEHILAATLDLVEAEKGLLLTSGDADRDGSLDLVVARGFDNDPADSALVQRFARKVLERDETVREDAPESETGSLTAADREIENLVAIPLYLRDRFHGVVVCANRAGGFDEVDDELLLALGDHAGAALHNGHLRRQLRETHHGGLRMLLEALAARDPLLYRQAVESAILAGSFADALGHDVETRRVLVLATLLRDVGYLTLPDRLLAHAGPLTIDERAVVELHPRSGFNILRQLPALRDSAFAVLYHHERCDGRGYPFGLGIEEIPPVARIVALVEAYEAITHDRPYRPPQSVEEACALIQDAAGSQFDPELAALFIEHVRTASPAPHDDLIDAVLEDSPTGGFGDAGSVLGALNAPDVDPLTLLPAHRAFRERLEAAVDEAEGDEVAALIMLQIDELERINQDTGYLAGDRLLQATARVADGAAARVGGAAYRVGGRRLGLVVRCNEELVASAVEQIQGEFAAGPSVTTSLTVGRRGMRPDELVTRAQAALKQAIR